MTKPHEVVPYKNGHMRRKKRQIHGPCACIRVGGMNGVEGELRLIRLYVLRPYMVPGLILNTYK
jgi:hypothetical protein